MQGKALSIGERGIRSADSKEHPVHLLYPTLEEQLKAHKNDYKDLPIESVLARVQEGQWTSSNLPEGADFWGTIIPCNSGHYLVDATSSKRRLAMRQPFYDRSLVVPYDLQRTDKALKAFAQLRKLQPWPVYIVAMQMGRTMLGGRSVQQRTSVHLPNEHGLGVKEMCDMLRVVHRLSSPADLGLDCSADRVGPGMVPCLSFENRAIVLDWRPTERCDFAFAEATWFMPPQ